MISLLTKNNWIQTSKYLLSINFNVRSFKNQTKTTIKSQQQYINNNSNHHSNENIITNQQQYSNNSNNNSKINKNKTKQQLQQQQLKQQQSQLLQQQEVLKTYLQIISPYQIQSLLQKQQIHLHKQIAICQQQQRLLTTQELSSIYKKIKKNVHVMKIQQLGKLIQVMNYQTGDVNKGKEQQGQDEKLVQEGQQGQQQQAKFVNQNSNKNNKNLILVKKIQNRIINIAKKKIHILTLEQIVNFMYKLVKKNKKEFQFMKQVERALIQQKIPINYPLIKKILYSFTHMDVGSSVLYSHISKTIKIGQHQLNPLELAESAYMLSKVTENATGGYGVFTIAQKHLQAALPRLQFHQLVKAASYMLTQNIGSNKFQLKLQEQIYRKFPNKITLEMNELVSLLKSTSAYYFKYKNNALLHMLKTATERMVEYSTLQQLQDIIWSWGRAGKGDKQLWQILQQFLLKKYITFLKPRQVSFLYHAICSTEYSSDKIVKALQQKFIKQIKSQQQQSKNIKPHYIVKFLLGMQKRKSYKQQKFLYLSKILCEQIPHLTPRQMLSFTRIINESDLHYASKQNLATNKSQQNKEQPELIAELQATLTKKLSENILKKIYLFKISEIIEILYMSIKLGLNYQQNSLFTQKMFEQIEQNIIEIPKNTFIKGLFCFIIQDRIKPALEMIPIIYQLMKYGPIGYYFSPYQLPLLAYCILHLEVNGKGQLKINRKLLSELCNILEQINPVMLNQFVKNGYEEALRLKQKYEQKNGFEEQSQKK